ncbi:hypothetical protein AAKU67_001237 [Oxalobacteraceae bacterium GrIS 2.11]
MQTIICSLIIFAAVVYVANRWMPFALRQRLMTLLGQTPKAKVQAGSGSCSSCSSCGNCGSDSDKTVKKVIFASSK